MTWCRTVLEARPSNQSTVALCSGRSYTFFKVEEEEWEEEHPAAAGAAAAVLPAAATAGQ